MVVIFEIGTKGATETHWLEGFPGPSVCIFHSGKGTGSLAPHGLGYGGPDWYAGTHCQPANPRSLPDSFHHGRSNHFQSVGRSGNDPEGGAGNDSFWAEAAGYQRANDLEQFPDHAKDPGMENPAVDTGTGVADSCVGHERNSGGSNRSRAFPHPTGKTGCGG